VRKSCPEYCVELFAVTLLIIMAAAVSIAASSLPTQECTGAAGAPALDHVVLVVRDLDRAAAPFQKHGFRLKEGRLHANNLLNRHIKFRDGSSLELMTVRGSPGDAMARDYADLAASGEGGVYVALKVARSCRRGTCRARAAAGNPAQHVRLVAFRQFPAELASGCGVLQRRRSRGSGPGLPAVPSPRRRWPGRNVGRWRTRARCSAPAARRQALRAGPLAGWARW
jgi:catechol 2,3-dioxygenase-like lactoylglutathione lyase family enzyme